MKQLQRGDETYRRLFGDEDLAVFVVSEGIEDCNDSACRLLGRTREQLRGQTPLDVSPVLQPDGTPSVEMGKRRIEAALAGLSQSFVWELRRADGEPVETLVQMEAVRLDSKVRLFSYVRDLSHLWRAEAALKESETRLKQILEHTSSVVVAKDLEGRYLFANPALERLVGVPVRELIGRPIRETFTSDVVEQFERHDLRVLEERRAIEFEENTRIHGEERTFLVNKFPLLGADGEPYAVCGVGTDITERKRTEHALRLAALAVSAPGNGTILEHLVRSLASILQADIAFVSVFETSDPSRMRTLATVVDGRVQACSDYALPGTPCAEVARQTFRFFPSAVGEQFPDDPFLSAMQLEGYAGFPLSDSAGDPMGLIAVMSRQPLQNIELCESILKIFAGRAAAEIGRNRTEEALRQSEASYRAIFEESEDAIFVHDWETGAIVDVNARACEADGYSRDEMLRMRVGDISAGEYPYTGEEAERYLQQAKQGPVRVEWRARHRSGGLAWKEICLKPARIGGVPRILAFSRDITARKTAEDALRVSEELYRAIFNGSLDGMVLRDESMRIVDTNPALGAMLGFTREELIGAQPDLYIAPELVKRSNAMLQRALAGESTRHESIDIRRDGSRFEVEIRSVPTRYRGEPHVLSIARDITESKRAERALQASEEQYRAMFNATLDGLVLRDADLGIVDVNAAFLEMNGYTREELFAAEPMAYVAPELRQRSEERLRRILSGDSSGYEQYESIGVRNDGTRFVCEVRAVPMNYQGQRHALSIVRDITDRKQAEQALRASEEQYRAIFNASVDGLVLRDEQLHVVDVNPAIERISGFQRDEIVGNGYTPFVPDDMREEADAHHRRALAGESVHFEARRRCKNGSVIDVELHDVPIQYRGKPHLLTIAREVTERKLVEHALRASEEQYRAIFEASVDGLVLFDTAGKVVDANPTFLAITAFSREETIGADFATFLPPDERSQCIERVFDPTLTGSPCHTECRAVRADGTQFDAEVRTVAIQYQGGPHILSIVRDITRRKKAEAERAALEGQLRQAQKMEALGHLTGGIAHDFNNILMSIMGSITLAAERHSRFADEKVATYLDRALRSSERARDLIKQMLTFSRGQRGDPRPIRLGHLIEESVSLLRSTLPSTLELKTTVAADASLVLLDPVQVEQVLLNLCINARDATKASGVVSIGVRALSIDSSVCSACRKPVAGTFVELSVEDDGIGIRPEMIERIFEPFFTTKDAGKGTGMGLATVHGIVHECGGHLLVDSVPGRGTTFRVLFPLHESAPGMLAHKDRQVDSGNVRATLSGHVLVVDDEEMLIELMRDLLEGWGLVVTTATNGIAALDAFAVDPSRFDLVITDQTMPRMTGFVLASELLSIRSALPIVLYTGYSDGLTEEQASAAGVKALLRKPVVPRDLLAVVRAHLSKSRAGSGAIRAG
ncbi:MAG: PAS domain S-box protein [Burkholderiales bacterium]